MAFKLIDVDISTIVGFLGIGLGFAFKDLLANFIGGVVILGQKKFKINDVVKIGEEMGTIINIDSRTTELKGFDGTSYIIPNASILTNVVQNFTSRSMRRISLKVGVHYSTPLDKAIEIIKNTALQHDSVLREPEVKVLVTEFGNSAINIEMRFWVDSSTSWWDVKSSLNQAIKKEFAAAGIVIPFPSRSLSLDPYDRNILQLGKINQ